MGGKDPNPKLKGGRCSYPLLSLQRLRHSRKCFLYLHLFGSDSSQELGVVRKGDGADSSFGVTVEDGVDGNPEEQEVCSCLGTCG